MDKYYDAIINSMDKDIKKLEETNKALYEALKYFVDKHQLDYMRLDNWIGIRTNEGVALLKAREALAKAEGKE